MVVEQHVQVSAFYLLTSYKSWTLNLLPDGFPRGGGEEVAGHSVG